MPNQKQNLNSIQVLRGIASLLVVFFHATASINESLDGDFLFDAFNFGAAGVDVFFVLSGFIITFTSINGAGQPQKLAGFLQRRAIRILPVYWIIATGFLLLQLLLPAFYKTPFPFDFPNLFSTYFLLPGHINVNGVSWSLSYELFFYAIFSLIFLCRNTKQVYLFFLLYTLVIVSLHLVGYNFSDDGGLLALITSPMNIEFFMGVLCALIVRLIPAKFSLYLFFTGCVIFILSGLLYNQGAPLLQNLLYRALTFGFASFLIITGIVNYELNKPINAHPVAMLLGEASYSLYLLHLPIIAAAVKVIGRLNINSILFTNIIMIVVIIMICLLSILFYSWIEKPLINKLNSVFSKKPVRKTAEPIGVVN